MGDGGCWGWSAQARTDEDAALSAARVGPVCGLVSGRRRRRELERLVDGERWWQTEGKGTT